MFWIVDREGMQAKWNIKQITKEKWNKTVVNHTIENYFG